ncbi:uncharacterized protein [Mytilus edulis]|uniref:Uncharacterized protein n=1 Tax=Mytilus edulis TaxID=6550 RepID=A0A8S3PPD0_MYTED|nr:unnamed protein product [Mytilus edulis]
MESKSDVELAIQALEDTEKLEVEYIKQLRMASLRLQNLQEDKNLESTLNEQNIYHLSRKIEERTAGNNKVNIHTATFQSNMNTLKEVLPKKRENKGRQTSHETDSGFGSVTSKVLNSNVMSGIQDTNPPRNEHQYCSEAEGESDDRKENDRDSDTEC